MSSFIVLEEEGDVSLPGLDGGSSVIKDVNGTREETESSKTNASEGSEANLSSNSNPSSSFFSQDSGIGSKITTEAESKMCLVCSQVGGTCGNLTLLDFCKFVQITVTPKLKQSFLKLETPLCDKCSEIVVNIRTLFGQIEDLEVSLNCSRALVKEQICLRRDEENIATGVDGCGGDREEALSEIANAVNSIRNSIRKDFAEAVFTKQLDSTKSTSPSTRKKPGRKPGKRTTVIESSNVKEKEGAANKLVEASVLSHRSSFGRVVKRPRFFMMSDDEGSDGEARAGDKAEDSEMKYDPSQSQVTLSSTTSTPTKNTLKPVKVEQISTSSSHDHSSEADLQIVGNYSKTEIKEGQSDGEIEFGINSSDGNWSDGGSDDEEKQAKKPIKKRSRRKSVIKKRKSSNVQVKLITQAGEELGTSEMKNGKVVINEDFHQKLVDGQAVVSIEEDNCLMGARVKCDKCASTFTDAKKRDRHLRRVHEGKPDFECSSCGLLYEKLKDLLQHRKEDHSVPKEPKVDEGARKTFDCEFCETVFRNSSDLQIHRRRHTGERPFKCEICSEGFISKGRYEVHIEVSHPNVAPLKCQYCPRSFFRHHRLRDHNKSHTGERPYLCEICSKSLSQPAYLKYHQTKHKELNLAEFTCDECDKKFASPVNLKFHKETQHQKKYRYHCTICNHGATHMSHMKLHMRSHTGERPHSCPHCDKTFSRGSQLKIHIRSHTGERPYICPTCTKSFTNSSKLRRHELTHLSNKARKRAPILKVTNLGAGSGNVQPPPVPVSSSSSSGGVPTGEVKFIRGDTISVMEDDGGSEANQGQSHGILKLEQFHDESILGQQILTIDQGNGVTYQVIATNDVNIIDEPYTEYVVLNGDFTIA